MTPLIKSTCGILHIKGFLVLQIICLGMLSAFGQKDSKTRDLYGVYAVIDSNLSLESLEKIREKLETIGVEFRFSNVQYVKGKLTAIHLEVNLPGFFSNQLTVDNQGNPLSHPIIFYHELGKTGLTNTVPKDVSKVTKSITDDNLKGLLILYEDHNMESIGTATTNWWKFM